MKARDFLKNIDHPRVVEAIKEAELKSSGEIRVFVSHKAVVDPVKAAQVAFQRLRMEKTRERNGVLLFVAPRSRNFAVIGDTGIHEKCGEPFWKVLAQELTEHFRQGQFTEGIVHSIRKAGVVLAKHFPRRPDDRNELPDEVKED